MMVKIYVTTSRELVYKGGEIIDKAVDEYIFELEKTDDRTSITQKLYYMCMDATYFGRVIPRLLDINPDDAITTQLRMVVVVRPENRYARERVAELIKQLLEPKPQAKPMLSKSAQDELNAMLKGFREKRSAIASAQGPSSKEPQDMQAPTTPPCESPSAFQDALLKSMVETNQGIAKESVSIVGTDTTQEQSNEPSIVPSETDKQGSVIKWRKRKATK